VRHESATGALKEDFTMSDRTEQTAEKIIQGLDNKGRACADELVNMSPQEMRETLKDIQQGNPNYKGSLSLEQAKDGHTYLVFGSAFDKQK
jgi:hypothetical protein